tara:strand:- start:1193 stop:1597 length:405 start_codon:yes stop_codon:yes gene_type:complete
MIKLNSTLKLVLLCSLLVFLGGCSSTSIKTKIINVPNEKWRVTGVWVSETENGWRVSGRFNSPNIFGLPDGHVIVSIVSEDGMILDRRKASYRRIFGNAGRYRKHQFGVAIFSVDFNSIPTDTEIVTQLQLTII